MLDKGTIGSTQALVWPTIFSCYQPVEQFHRLAELSGDVEPTPSVALLPIDAYLMWQVTAFYPIPPTVIDLAAAATAGDSAVFWAATSHLQTVLAPQTGETSSTDADWRARVTHAGELLGLDTRDVLSDVRLDEAGGWQALQAGLNPLAPVMISLTLPETDPAAIETRLAQVWQAWPDAIVFVMPLGRIGASAVLETTLAFCKQEPALQLTALRELSPFFATSQLGLIYPKRDKHMPAVLERLRQLFEGNFQLLTLAQEVITAAIDREEAKRERQAREEAVRQRNAFEQSNQELYNRSVGAEVKHVLIRLTPAPVKRAVKNARRSDS